MNGNKRTPVIECQSVYKVFGKQAFDMLKQSNGVADEQALKEAGCIIGVNNVSLKVNQGEMLVVMGLSGSGKSTLIRCISRLTDTTAGSIFIEGQNLLQMSEKRLIELRRHKMGMVFQNFALLPHKTVLENISFPLEVKGMSITESHTRAREMIELVSLQGRETSFPRQLSGGQQQRVGIARSLAVKPDIWLLDEPFSALDPLIRREMQDEFLRLQGMLNKTIVFITHDFDEALRLADRIAIMYEGKIEQIDTPENIVLNPASEYVKKFTKEVPREKVLTVKSVMTKTTDAKTSKDLQVNQNNLIEDIALQVESETLPIEVLDDSGQIVGHLHREQIMQIFFEKD